jgi:putative transposase
MGVPEMLLETARYRHEKEVWHVRLILVMPDHVHALIRVPIEGSLKRVVSDWKRWTATKGEFSWQRDFFDHRLRTERSEREKADYILENPVRAGLVSRSEDWPHLWIPSE